MPEHQAIAPHSPGQLFMVFTRLAMKGFGGVLPVAQHELVDRERWLTREQFLEMLGMAQVLPGPNIVNLALMIGDRFFAWRGALAAMAGILLAPLGVVLVLAVLAKQAQGLPALGSAVNGALRGMGVVAAGLIFAMAWKLGRGLRSNVLGPVLCAVVLGLTVLSIGWLRWPLAYTVLGLGSLATLLAWWRLPK
ncbi:MAG TPA: chromate transporter [Rubrivivax sp.]|nr:chromate transporter [Rubrivivax sp.]HLL19033.1 chromate transporter [Rubrivivax sp.]